MAIRKEPIKEKEYKDFVVSELFDKELATFYAEFYDLLKQRIKIVQDPNTSIESVILATFDYFFRGQWYKNYFSYPEPSKDSYPAWFIRFARRFSEISLNKYFDQKVRLRRAFRLLSKNSINILIDAGIRMFLYTASHFIAGTFGTEKCSVEDFFEITDDDKSQEDCL